MCVKRKCRPADALLVSDALISSLQHSSRDLLMTLFHLPSGRNYLTAESSFKMLDRAFAPVRCRTLHLKKKETKKKRKNYGRFHRWAVVICILSSVVGGFLVIIYVFIWFINFFLVHIDRSPHVSPHLTAYFSRVFHAVYRCRCLFHHVAQIICTHLLLLFNGPVDAKLRF